MNTREQDILNAISRHNVLRLAGLQGEERAQVARQRYYEVLGMIEVLRRLPEYHDLLPALEQYRDQLKRIE